MARQSNKVTNSSAASTNNTLTNKYNNSLYNVQLQDTNHCDDGSEDVVVKNTPFLIVVTPSSPTAQTLFTKDDVQVQLVYDSSTDAVTFLKTKPLEYNVYIKDRSMTIETRLHVLSSKHENNLFRVSVQFGSHTIVTDSIKCVSKLDKKRKAAAIQHHVSQAPTSQSSPPQHQPVSSPLLVPQSPEQLSSDEQQPVVARATKRRTTESSTATTTSNTSSTVPKSIKKLKRQQKKDRELISLLYKQNMLLLNQVNTLTAGLNTLITVHNETVSVPSSPASTSMYSPMSPGASAPSSPSMTTTELVFPSINPDAIDLQSTNPEAFNTFSTLSYESSNAPSNSCSSSSDADHPCADSMAVSQQQQQDSAIQSNNFVYDEQVMDMNSFIGVTNTSGIIYNPQQLLVSTNLELQNMPYSHSTLLDLNIGFSSVGGFDSTTLLSSYSQPQVSSDFLIY
eukprot:gene12985-15271_t